MDSSEMERRLTDLETRNARLEHRVATAEAEVRLMTAYVLVLRRMLPPLVSNACASGGGIDILAAIRRIEMLPLSPSQAKLGASPILDAITDMLADLRAAASHTPPA